MKSAYKNGLGATCASVLFLSSPELVVAQQAGSTASGEQKAEAQPGGLEEIVVTANRRAERLSDVGIAVSVLSGGDLSTKGAQMSTDLAQFTPGVYVGGSMGGMAQQYTIRGVTQSDYLDAIEAPVAQYVDDVYIPFAQGQKLAVFDVSRVEVLKGPQGTLFGRNATGGLVHTVINKPDYDRVGGYVTASYGSDEETTLEGALNIPLGSVAALRVSGFYDKLGDWVDNVFPADAYIKEGSLRYYSTPDAGLSLYETRPSFVGKDGGGHEITGGRIQLGFKPSDSLDIRLTAMSVKTDFGPAAFYATAVRPVLNEAGQQINVVKVPSSDGIFGGYMPLDPDTFKIASIYTPESDAKSSLVSGQINWTVGDVTLTSVTAWQHHTKHFNITSSGSPIDLVEFKTDGEDDAFTQEIRVGGKTEALDYTAGVFYMHNDVTGTKGFSSPAGSVFGSFFGLQDSTFQFPGIANLKTDSTSLYGQVDWHFTPELTLVAGGRIIQEKQDWTYDAYGVYATDPRHFDLNGERLPGALGEGWPRFTDNRTDDLWAAKLQLEYRPNPGLLLYAGVNRGTKAGAYNAPDYAGGPPLADDRIPYDPEVLWNYEAGTKYSTGSMLLSASAFYYDYPSYQAFLYSNLANFVTNQKMKTYGFEVTAQGRITDNLRASAAASYTKAQINDFAIAEGVFKDVEPPFAPSTQFSADLDYTIPAQVAGGDITLNANGSYNSSFYVDILNYDASKVDSHWLANFNATWKGSGGFSASAYLRNAFDEQYPGIGFNVAIPFQYLVLNYNRGRSYGLTLSYEFGNPER